MTVWHVIFPVLAVTPLLVNGGAMRHDSRHGEAFGIGLTILAVWTAQMILAAFLPIPERAGFNALLDFSAGLTVLSSWMSRRAAWKLSLLGLYLGQIYLSAAFWWGWEIFNHAIRYGDYVRANNVVWLLEIVVVSVGGGIVVVRRAVHDFRDRLDRHRHMGLPT